MPSQLNESSRESELPTTEAVESPLVAKVQRAAKNARHEAVFPVFLLLLWLLILRGVALPLGGLIVAGFSLFRIQWARKLIRENALADTLLKSLSASGVIAWLSVLLCVAAILWSVLGARS